MVRFWNDIKDIKLFTYETLNQYARREELIGWIPGDQGVNGAELAEEITRLIKENTGLHEKMAKYEVAGYDVINGMLIDDFIEILESEYLDDHDFSYMYEGHLLAIKTAAGNETLNLFHALCGLAGIIDGVSDITLSPCLNKLSLFGIIKLSFPIDPYVAKCEFTDDGRKIFMYLKENDWTQKIYPESKNSSKLI